MEPYYEYTAVDRSFYTEHIEPRIPRKIYDAHVHLNLPEHVKDVPPERLRSDWAMECGHVLPVEDAYRVAGELFPDSEYFIAGFAWPIREADIRANNDYLARMQKENRIRAFMCVKPDWDLEMIEAGLVENNFVGFKPYPDMFSGVKGADISILDFLPREQWKLLQNHKKAVMLHLPRKGRLPDRDNVRELLDIRQAYPDVTIIIAHFGRSFCPRFLEEGLKKLEGGEGFFFDTAAVINPAVYDVAFNELPAGSILFGTDMPITFWHGKREWTDRTYINLARENFSWNKNRRSAEEEAAYTIVTYEQVRAILDGAERAGLGGDDLNAVFHGNAQRVLGVS